MRISTQLLNQANTALDLGITIPDPENDEISIGEKESSEKGEKPNNPDPYREPYLDMKSIAVGIDDEYLYVKVTYYGIIPDRAPDLSDGDQLYANTTKMDIIDAHDQAQAILTMEYSYLPVIRLPGLNTYYATDPTGVEWPENARFASENRDSKIAGGHGTDFVMMAVPLSTLKIKQGDIINFIVGNETGSPKYDHASADVLGKTLSEEEKEGSIYVWKTDTQNYSTREKYTDNTGKKE